MKEKGALSVNWACTIRSHKGCKCLECACFSFGQCKAKLTPTADNQRWTLVLREGIHFLLSYPGKRTDIIIWEELAACIQSYIAGLKTQHRWGSRGLSMMKSFPGWLSSSKSDIGGWNGGFSPETISACLRAADWFTWPLNIGKWKFPLKKTDAYSPSFQVIGVRWEQGWVFWYYTGSTALHFLYFNLKVGLLLQEMERLRLNSFIKLEALMYDSICNSSEAMTLCRK